MIGPRGIEWAQRVVALVDSGCDCVFASRPIQQAIGAQPDPATETVIRIGGAPRPVRFAEVTLQLLPPPDAENDPPIEWRTDVGFFQEQWEPSFAVVLGRRGFFDRFTVTFHGQSRQFVVENHSAFDLQYGMRGPRR